MAYIHLYKGTVTSGGTDGALCSEGDMSSPLSTANILNTGAESGVITAALRCDSGYATSTSTVLTPSSDKWALSADGTTWGAWGAALTITSIITAVNTLIYVKAKSAPGESPIADTSAKITITTTTVAA